MKELEYLASMQLASNHYIQELLQVVYQKNSIKLKFHVNLYLYNYRSGDSLWSSGAYYL